MGISKVVYGGNTLIDLTADTVTAADLLQGVTAHGADGEAVTGTYQAGAPIAVGTANLGTSRATVNIGFRPKYLCIWAGSSRNAISTYNADWSTTKAYYSGASTSSTSYTMSSDSTNYRLHSITDTGFTVNKASQATNMLYFAIGYPPE